MSLFEIGKRYKIETKKGIFYTAKVVAISNQKIKIHTQRNEMIILDEDEIARAPELDREGETDETFWTNNTHKHKTNPKLS